MNTIRVGIAQIATLPSIRLDLIQGINTMHVRGEENPFLFLSHPTDLEDDAARIHDTNLDTLTSLKALNVRFAEEYHVRLLAYIRQIIAGAVQRSVRLLVFPEYSIPSKLLPTLSDIATDNDLHIIAGTHMLWNRELAIHPYASTIQTRIGSNWNKIAVCPILIPRNNPSFVFKQITSRYEPDLEEVEDPGRSCIRLDLGTAHKSISVAVTICSEFLLGDSTNAMQPDRRQLIDTHQEEADFIIIPAWSPDVEPFKKKAFSFLDERPHGSNGSILVANTAVHGNSFILVRGDKVKTFTYPLSEGIEGVIIRDLPFGSGAGPAYVKPPGKPHAFVLVEESPLQRRLWNLAAKCSTSASSSSIGPQALSELDALPRVLPKSLQPVYDSIRRALRPSATEYELRLDTFWLLRPKSSIGELVQAHLCAFYDYFSTQLKGGSSWQSGLSSFMFYLTQRLDAMRRLRPGIDEAASGLESRIAPSRSEPSGVDEGSAGPLIEDPIQEWRRFVSEEETAAYHLCIRVVGIPDEQRGITYQTRLIAQLLALLHVGGKIEKIEQRFVKKAVSEEQAACEVFLLFRFDSNCVKAGQTADIALQVFHICYDRSLVYRFTAVDMKSPWFADFSGDTALSTAHTTTYSFSRVGLPEGGKVFPFSGKGEATSILYLQNSQPGVNRLRIMLYRPDMHNEEQAESSLDWSDSHPKHGPSGVDAFTSSLRGVIQTSVEDIQDVQDASLAVLFKPSLFRPDTQQGTIPVIPAEIVFESDQANSDLVAEAIGYELAGPQRCSLNLDSTTKLRLAERECFHVLRLPFGLTPGFRRDDNRFLAIDRLVQKQSGGLYLGDVLTRKTGRQHLYWDDVARCRHMHVIGKSGTGKSYFLSSLISRDILAGRGVMVIDPHGELIDTILPRIPLERACDVTLFDPGDTDFPPGLNLFEANLGDHFERSMVMEEAVSLFIKLYGAEIFGPRIQQYFRGATLSLMDYGFARGIYPTLLDVARIYLDSDFRNTVKRYVKDRVAELFWKEFEASSDRETREMIPYFQAKFGSLLSNRIIRNVIGQQRSLIRFRNALEQGSIILVNLSKGKIGDMNANLLGLILIAKLNWAVMGRASSGVGNKKTFCLYIDEFQNIASSTFCNMLSEARKYGLSMVLAHQYLSQLKIYESYNRSDPDGLLKAINGNVGTIVAFQLGQADALEVAREMRIKRPEVGADVLQNLSDYMGLITTSISGERFPASYFQSVPWHEKADSAFGRELEVFAKRFLCEGLSDVELGIDATLHGVGADGRGVE